jgi:dGTPase
VATVLSQQNDTGHPLRIIAHSPRITSGKKDLEAFLFRKVYRSERVMSVRLAAQEKLSRLFQWYCDHPDSIAPSYRERTSSLGLRRSVADYLAGMTDRYLEWDHDRRV